MIVSNWHMGKVVSFSVACCVIIEISQVFLHSETNARCHCPALRLYGVIKTKPPQGFFMANVDYVLRRMPAFLWASKALSLLSCGEFSF